MTAEVSSPTVDFNSVRWSHLYPEVAAHPVRVEPYVSPEYYALEQERLFKKVWLYVGREERVANPGDYMVKDFDVAKTSIIVVRGRDGQLRAFHNVCTHRGNRLLSDRGGSCKQMTCIFHGWAFKLDGSLSGVPGERQFHEFDKADHGLVPVHVDTWEGFVFIHFAPEPDETLAEYIGGMADDVTGFPFSTMTHSYTYKTKIKTNWKLGVDAFQEFYHTGFIHKASVAKTVNGPDNPVSSLLLTKLYDRHRLLSGWGNPLYRPTPMEMASFHAGMSMANMLTVDDGIAAEFPANLNPTGHDKWSFDLNVFFPNFILFRFTNLTFTHEFWPSAHDECEWILTLSFPEPRNAGELFSRQQTSITGRDGSLEDLFTLEQTYAGLLSGAISEMTLQDNELSIRHGSKVVEDYVGFYR